MRICNKIIIIIYVLFQPKLTILRDIKKTNIITL